MATSDGDLRVRVLREIESTLAGMRHDRMVMPVLNRRDSSIDGLSAEVRALRSQFDRSRNKARAFQNEMRERPSRIEDALLHKAR
jgi:hypothetical protein